MANSEVPDQTPQKVESDQGLQCVLQHIGKMRPKVVPLTYDFTAPFLGTTSMIIVCVEVLRPSQPNGAMSSAVSLPNHTFTG